MLIKHQVLLIKDHFEVLSMLEFSVTKASITMPSKLCTKDQPSLKA